MSAGSASHNRRPASKPKGSVRAKSGCYTCRIRRKKCDEKPDAEGNCQTCTRLRLQCLGFGTKRPDWMREGNNVKELRVKIKDFLAQNGMIKGHSSSLRSSATLAIQGENTTVTTRTVQTSSPSMSLPPLQSLPTGSTVGLSTPVSETSTLTPEGRSTSPPSPSESHAHSQSYFNRQLPPGNSHPSLRSQHEHAMGGIEVESPSSTAGVLHLSYGRPTPRTRPQVSFSEASRRSHHGGDGFGEALSGTGYAANGLDLVTMDNSLDIGNNTLADSPYRRAPELAPDSPRLSFRTTETMLGQYAGSTSIPHPHLTGQNHSQGNVYAGATHQVTGQYTLHPSRYGGIGHGGIGTPHGSHGQTAASSSWAGDDYLRHPQTQEHLLHQQQQQQIQAQGQLPGPYVLTHEPYRNDSGALRFRDPSPLRGPDVPPPSVQSSFSPLYYIPNDFPIDDTETFAAQQPQMNSMNIGGASDATLMSYYGPAPISGLDFYALPQEQRQQIYQDVMAIQSLQPAPADPLFADRGDGSLVQHYLEHVRPVQYFFLDSQVVDLLRVLAFNNEAVRNAICSVASVHKRHMREGASLRRGSKTPSPPRRASLLLSGVDAPEGDDNNAYYDSTRSILMRIGTERLTKAEAMAGLQCISSFLFAGGAGGWDFFLNIACQWVDGIFMRCQRADNSHLLDKLVQMKREDELGSFIVRTTMWFEVLASVTMARAPRFLDIYRQLFGSTDGARIVEVGGDTVREEPEFSMLHVMGCDNLTFLALAEISALAAWKEEETKKQTLSSRQLVLRGSEIEERYLRAITKTGPSMCRDRSDSLENRRQLTADIFRASARLYLSTVFSGDKPKVPEIREGVRETIEALQRVPDDPKSLHRSVVRSVVFPICLAGCMADDGAERATLKAFLIGEGGAGNCGSVVDVMETVWERRDAQRRGGRRASERMGDDVSWRDVLREEGKGIPILLV